MTRFVLLALAVLGPSEAASQGARFDRAKPAAAGLDEAVLAGADSLVDRDLPVKSVGTHLLAAVLARAVGGDLRGFAERVLFSPAGMVLREWDVDATGQPVGAPRCTSRFATCFDSVSFI